MSRKMSLSEIELEEILMMHVDSLVNGLDVDDRIVDYYPKITATLRTLFGLARRLSETLVPEEPSETFVTDLKAALVAMGKKRPGVIAYLKGHRKVTLPIAGVAGLAMAAIVVRVIMGMISRRRATTAA